MGKYDVTGVGLNLATAEEFVRKSGLPLPPHAAAAEVRALSGFLCLETIIRKAVPVYKDTSVAGVSSSDVRRVAPAAGSLE